jgi:hypothetical protein
MAFPPLAPGVVVNDFDIMGSIILPYKADTELIVDTDAVLTLPVADEGLQAIARRNSQIVQIRGSFHLIQLAERHAFDVPPALAVSTNEQLECVVVLEVLDHAGLGYNVVR